MKLPSAIILVRTGGGDNGRRAPGEGLRDRGATLIDDAAEERVEDAGLDERGESSTSRAANGL